LEDLSIYVRDQSLHAFLPDGPRYTRRSDAASPPFSDWHFVPQAVQQLVKVTRSYVDSFFIRKYARLNSPRVLLLPEGDGNAYGDHNSSRELREGVRGAGQTQRRSAAREGSNPDAGARVACAQGHEQCGRGNGCENSTVCKMPVLIAILFFWQASLRSENTLLRQELQGSAELLEQQNALCHRLETKLAEAQR
jgi:hypothetical protein